MKTLRCFGVLTGAFAWLLATRSAPAISYAEWLVAMAPNVFYVAATIYGGLITMEQDQVVGRPEASG
jgi:hypothetical protein